MESVTSSFTPILNSWAIANSNTNNYSNYNFNTHDSEVLSYIIQGTSTITYKDKRKSNILKLILDMVFDDPEEKNITIRFIRTVNNFKMIELGIR